MRGDNLCGGVTVMNYKWHRYKVKGIDAETKKVGTLTVTSRDKKSAEKILKKQGLNPPYEFKEIGFAEPTQAQLDYASNLGLVIVQGMNRNDVSALISRKEDDDEPASEELKQFAYIKNIHFSPFIGENALRDILQSELENGDLKAFEKQFPEPVENDDVTEEIVPPVDNFVDGGIYDESYSIDGQNGKVRLNYYSVVIKRGGSKTDLIIPFKDIEDIHVGISKSFFELNYIRFVRAADDKTYYKPSDLPKSESAVTFADNKYLAVCERIKQRLEVLGKKFTPTGNYTNQGSSNTDNSTWHYFKLGLKIGVLLVLGFIILLVMPSHERRNKSENVPPPAPKVEEKVKSSEPEMSTTENIYNSKMAIQRMTGMEVTDFWAMQFGESLTADKTMIMTQGAIELNNDGVKRLFWCHFDAGNKALLRLKIDGELIYTAIGW